MERAGRDVRDVDLDVVYPVWQQAVVAEGDDDVLRLRDEDDGGVVVHRGGEPQLVVRERRHLLAAEVPEQHLRVAKGEEALVLVQKDEGERRLEALPRHGDGLVRQQVDDEQRLPLLRRVSRDVSWTCPAGRAARRGSRAPAAAAAFG